ncbi:MAG: hypothetical protein ABJC89_13915, partial [Acidobacteriota bacterium]
VLQVGALQAAGDVGCSQRVREARERMFDSLAISSLTIHAVDTKGLVTIGPQTNTQVHGAQGGPDYQGPRERLAMQQRDTTDLLDLHGTLRVLAEQTGGRAVMDTNTPDAKVPEILRESGGYYLLAFDRDPGAPADARRKIEVRVSRKGTHIYTQRQYLAPPQDPLSGRGPLPDARQLLTTAIAGLLPNSGVPLVLAASPFALADDDRSSLKVVIDVGAFAQATGSVPLEIRVAAIKTDGNEAGGAQQTSTVPPDSGNGARPPVVNVTTHLELAPGDYEVRAAVADPSRGRVASVFQQVTVPAFAKAALSLSGITIERSGDRLTSDAPADEPSAPLTQRTFSRADRISAVSEVYQGTQRSNPIVPVSLRLKVADARGTPVHEETVALTAESFQHRRASSRLIVPLERLEPGDYLLSIEAKSAQQSAGRALRFTVN